MRGDITETDLGLSMADEDLLIHDTDYIIHIAALIGINHTREEFWSVNVDGTEHMLDFARRVHADHGLKRFLHVSTAYVAGSRSGLISEDSGEFCVHKCYFSEFYTPDVCAVISSLDEGIFAGLYGGGILKFNERITDGYDVCRAEFKRQPKDLYENRCTRFLS